jgi:GTP-binding protein EngB required for normal cell division
MKQLLNEIAALLEWYEKHARSAIEDFASDRLAGFDAQRVRLQRIAQFADAEVAACFLGQSGVGKSTLINALVGGSEVILPAGGVGPLTAQALEVRYSERPMFTVQYHRMQQFWQLVFALEQKLLRQREKAGDSELEQELAGEDLTVGLDDAQVVDHLERQGRLIITGNQNSTPDLGYLVDCLRIAGGKEPKWNSVPIPEDLERIDRIKRVLQLASRDIPHTVDAALGNGEFLRELRIHAAGFLAPFIRQIELGWPSTILETGLRLVDLPGVGISSDAYRVVTEKWVREKAQAVCLVVHKSGIDAASADLLRSSGFLNRLLHSTDDPEADPVDLIVAVTMLDNVATAEYREEKQSNPLNCRSRRDHLALIRQKMPAVIATQLETELKRIVSDLEGSAKEASDAATRRLLDKLKVYPLTAHEFVRVLQQDDEEHPFISHPDESGVPEMQSALGDVVQARRSDMFRRLRDVSNLFREQVTTTLRTIEAQWQDPEAGTVESERIRRELQEFIPTKREEFSSRKGAFREFLKKGVPEKIEMLVEQASGSALEEMRRNSRKFHDMHWATLRASVRKGGTFNGAHHIDLPRDYSLMYDGQIAPIWGQQVIKIVRQRTKELGEDYVSLIEEIVAWAEDHGARSQKRVLEALRDQIKVDAKALASVGKEATDELRQRVRDQLLRTISAPIQKRCQKFVEEGHDVGRGVKLRILDLFDDLLPTVVATAKTPALRVLSENYEDVQIEIREQLKKNADPLKTAEEAILSGHQEAERRSMAQRRKLVLERLESILAAWVLDLAPEVVGSAEVRNGD